MSTTSLHPLVRRLARLAGGGLKDDLSDADLLDRFRAGGEEAAFALLVQRHGPAVLGVCRRQLGNEADAEDAFQATFLVLLRKAGSIRSRASLASWLHGVAFRLAATARARRPHFAALAEVPAGGDGPAGAAARREVRALLDEEIGRLPDRYREPLVLCGLEGKTCEQAARELGWPKSSLAHRLRRAKDLLRGRLLRRGVAAPAASLTGALAAGAGAAAPAPLVLATVRLASRARVGGAPAEAAAVVLASGAERGTAPAVWAALLTLAAAVSVAAVAGSGSLAWSRGEPGPPSGGPPQAAGAPPAEGRGDREGFPLPAEALARVGSARLRHGRQLLNLTYSPDGRLLASSGQGLVRLWDAGTGKLRRSIAVGGGGRIPDGIFSADGKAVVALDGETCRWFDARTGEEVRRCDVKFPRAQSHACFAPRGEAIAVACTAPGQDLVVYDLPSGKERFRKAAGHAWFPPLAFSPDGRVLAAVEAEHRPFLRPKRVVLFAAAGGEVLGEFDPGELFRELAFSPDGKRLLGFDGGAQTLFVWAVPGGEALHRTKAPADIVVLTASFEPGGRGVLLGGQDGDAVLIDPATGKELRRFRTHPASGRFVFAPGGKTLARYDVDGVITQWDFATGRPLAASADPITGRGQLQFDGGGKRLWVAADTFAAIDWPSGREASRVRVPHHGTSWAVTLSPDRSRVAGVNAARKLAVWDAATGREGCVLPAPGAAQAARAFSLDGGVLYTAERGGPVRAWDTRSGKELPPFDKGKRVTRALAVSPDGRWLAAAEHPEALGGQQGGVTVWDLRGGREAHRLRLGARPAWGLAFSPDGTLLAAVGGQFPAREGRDAFVAVWDLRTGKERVFHAGLPARLGAAAFSADGRLLATGGDDGALRLWEVATGQERHRFVGHASGVYSVAFSPDGKLVAAGSADAPVFLWDVTGCHGRPPSATAFTAAEKDRLWEALAGADAAAAFGAMRRLMARAGPAAALLADRLKPAATAEVRVIEQHIAALDADAFGARQKAAAELAKVIDQAEQPLRRALKNAPSAEAKRRIEALLRGAEVPSPERLRELRAVEVLERAGTAEARKLLGELAGRANDARLTREAKEALGRMPKP